MYAIRSYYVQVIVHLIAIKKYNLCRIFTFKKHKKKEENRFYKSFFGATMGSSTAHISAFLDTWLASFLVSGSISYLYYANRVFQLPLALFAIATSIALFPMIARSIKNKDEERALYLMKKSSLILLGLLGVATLIGVVFNQFIIELLFQRGAFTQMDTQNTALILSMYLIGLIPFGLAKIFSLWLYAHEKQFVAAKISMKALGANIIVITSYSIHYTKLYELNKKTPILAMTANAMDSAKDTCLESGMNGIITKPIRKNEFLNEVHKWVSY